MEQYEFEQFIRQEFLTEASELIQQLEDLFIELERGDRDDSIDRIFRVAHTLKGSGFTAGFEDLGKVAHEFESVLDDIRNGKRESNEDLVSLFLGITDALSNYVKAQMSGNGYDLNNHESCKKLKNLIHGQNQGANPSGEDKSTVSQAAEVQKASKSGPQNLPSFERVLVVDDENDICELMVEVLSDYTNKSDVAKDGVEALKLFGENDYDLVITDIYMPNMTGVEFVRNLRKTDRSTPVIFFSGFATREDLMEVLDLGGVDFWSKPLDIDLVDVSLKNAQHYRDSRRLIAKLSALNYRAYVDAMRVSSFSEVNDPSIEPVKVRLDETLKEISELTHKLLGTSSQN